MKKPKIVVVGGGTGLPVVLNSLRNHHAEITAIVTVADDGGSSGALREFTNVPPPGDLRNVLVALSDMPKFYEKIFQYRFDENTQYFANHSIGNMILVAAAQIQGSMYKAIQMLGKIMHIDGAIYPVSEEPLTLHAVFTDGTQVAGESKIAKENKKIDYVYLTNQHNESSVKANPKVVKAILSADMVVLGPGSLFTSVLPNLVIAEIGEAIKTTQAEVVYICNIMTQKGETEHFTDADHIRMLHRHLQANFIDTALVNIEPLPKKGADFKVCDECLAQVVHNFAELRAEGCRVISTNFLKLRDNGVFHNGDLVVKELFRLLSNCSKVVV